MSHDWVTTVRRRCTGWAYWSGTTTPNGTVLVVDRYRPGVAIYVRPCWRRRRGLVRSPFATRTEMTAWRAAWDTQ